MIERIGYAVGAFWAMLDNIEMEASRRYWGWRARVDRRYSRGWQRGWDRHYAGRT